MRRHSHHGATVSIVDAATSVARSTTANDDGQYIFGNIPPGSYTLSATRTGFRATKIIAQDVKVNVTSTVNIHMEVGWVTETIEVTATNAELQAANATIGNGVSGGAALDALPSISRDASTFVTLQPGVSPDGSVAGAVYDQTSFQLDGGQNTNDMDGSVNIYTPASPATSPAASSPNRPPATPAAARPASCRLRSTRSKNSKSSTTNQTADFNSSAGSQVSMIAGRGTTGALRHRLRVLPRQQLVREHVRQQRLRHARSRASTTRASAPPPAVRSSPKSSAEKPTSSPTIRAWFTRPRNNQSRRPDRLPCAPDCSTSAAPTTT